MLVMRTGVVKSAHAARVSFARSSRLLLLITGKIQEYDSMSTPDTLLWGESEPICSCVEQAFSRYMRTIKSIREIYVRLGFASRTSAAKGTIVSQLVLRHRVERG